VSRGAERLTSAKEDSAMQVPKTLDDFYQQFPDEEA